MVGVADLGANVATRPVTLTTSTTKQGPHMPTPEATLSCRHRIKLPKEVRDTLDWKPGEELSVVRRRDGVYVCKRISLDWLFAPIRQANPESPRNAAE